MMCHQYTQLYSTGSRSVRLTLVGYEAMMGKKLARKRRGLIMSLEEISQVSFHLF